jgi:TRAP-type C4-dicarboxylate transport system permease small subunit
MVQLLLNIVLLIGVGIATLRFQRRIWRRIQSRHSRANLGQAPG